MKHVRWMTVLVTFALPLASATHDSGCTVQEEDPATYLLIDTVLDLDGDGLSEVFYCEEKDTGLPPVPLTGLLLGNGTYCYRENREWPGLQARHDGIGLFGDWFPPGCDQNPDWQPTDGTVPCLIIDENPINDDSDYVCGHEAFWDDPVLF